MDMVERVSGAISIELENRGIRLTDDVRELLGRAAIAAMRAPTGAMTKAGFNTAHNIIQDPHGVEESTVAHIFNAMLDAACPPSPVERG